MGRTYHTHLYQRPFLSTEGAPWTGTCEEIGDKYVEADDEESCREGLLDLITLTFSTNEFYANETIHTPRQGEIARS